MNDVSVGILRNRLVSAWSTLPIAMLSAALILRAFSFTSTGLDWDESLYIVIANGFPTTAIADRFPPSAHSYPSVQRRELSSNWLHSPQYSRP